MIRTIAVIVTLGALSAIGSGAGLTGSAGHLRQADRRDRPPRMLRSRNAAASRHHRQRTHIATRQPRPPRQPHARRDHPPPTATAAANQQHTDENIGLEGKELHKKLKEQGVETKPEPVKPIVSTIARLLPRPDNEYAFELDNGQTWEQAESKALDVNPHDTVTIQPGVLGAFFMTTQRHQGCGFIASGSKLARMPPAMPSPELALAQRHDAAGRYDDAINELARGTAKGDLPCMRQLGKRLLTGENAPLLAADGASFLLEAANKGDAEAAARISGAHCTRPLSRSELDRCAALADSRRGTRFAESHRSN